MIIGLGVFEFDAILSYLFGFCQKRGGFGGGVGRSPPPPKDERKE